LVGSSLALSKTAFFPANLPASMTTILPGFKLEMKKAGVLQFSHLVFEWLEKI
jgi:hypothetical protein